LNRKCTKILLLIFHSIKIWENYVSLNIKKISLQKIFVIEPEKKRGNQYSWHEGNFFFFASFPSLFEKISLSVFRVSCRKYTQKKCRVELSTLFASATNVLVYDYISHSNLHKIPIKSIKDIKWSSSRSFLNCFSIVVVIITFLFLLFNFWFFLSLSSVYFRVQCSIHSSTQPETIPLYEYIQYIQIRHIWWDVAMCFTWERNEYVVKRTENGAVASHENEQSLIARQIFNLYNRLPLKRALIVQ
jgi:hypothetical protein